MRTKETAQNVALATASTATTAILATAFKGATLKQADLLVIDAFLDAPSAGTLDVYLERKIAANTWRQWIHFPQLTANTVKYYTLAITGQGATIVETGSSTDATPTLVLAANTAINVIPGDDVRIVCVTGAGTANAGAVDITITPYTERK
jgi:hypothetical protein